MGRKKKPLTFYIKQVKYIRFWFLNKSCFIIFAIQGTQHVILWLTQSGLKINEKKTEICIFHRTITVKRIMVISNTPITTTNSINILGIIFDSNLNWNKQYNNAISDANQNLHAIRIIAKYFTKDEIKTLLTSLYYSKLYYGSEVWHLPGRTETQNKKLKFASANAIRSCNKSLTIYNTHTQIHKSASRAMPDQMIIYKHALVMHKLINSCQPEQEFLNLNFQLNQNPRIQHANFFNRSNYESGKNILLNRLSHLNNKIPKDWLELSLDTFKVKCKTLFLQIR